MVRRKPQECRINVYFAGKQRYVSPTAFTGPLALFRTMARRKTRRGLTRLNKRKCQLPFKPMSSQPTESARAASDYLVLACFQNGLIHYMKKTLKTCVNELDHSKRIGDDVRQGAVCYRRSLNVYAAIIGMFFVANYYCCHLAGRACTKRPRD